MKIMGFSCKISLNSIHWFMAEEWRAKYPLVMTNSLPWYRWPIEIDGLPFLKMVDLSIAMLNNMMVTIHTRFPHQLANRIWDTCINQSGCCIKHRVLESISKILTFGNNTCDRHIAAIHQNNHWVFIPPKFIWGNAIIQSAFGNVHVDNVQMASILWMEEILHHLGWLKTYKQWDKPPINWWFGFRNHPPYGIRMYHRFWPICACVPRNFDPSHFAARQRISRRSSTFRLTTRFIAA